MVENQEKLAMSAVTQQKSVFNNKPGKVVRKEQNLNQFLNQTHQFKKVQSVKVIQVQTPTPKLTAVQKYVNLRLPNCKSITPIKYSIEVPSTADYLSRKTKSTYQDMSSTCKFKNSRDNYNQSLQEIPKLIEIKDEYES